MSNQLNPSLNCVKCQKGLNYLPYHSYAEPPAMKSKEGEFYCFDCFKSVSHCKVCGKSVAQMDINIHDKNTWYQPWEKIYWREAEHIRPFDMCGKYCDFLCSPECFANDENRNIELAKSRNQEKLQQGWKYCEECVKRYTKMFERVFNGRKDVSLEEIISYWAYVVPPGEKICEFDKRQNEKDTYIKQVIYPKAQKWWDNLTYEQKLAEVKRHDIHWIIRKGEEEGRKSTHQEVAQEKEIPPFIISQEFEHNEPCISCGKVWKCVSEINCGQNSPNGKTSYCASCPPSPSSSSKENNVGSEVRNGQSDLISEVSEIESKKLRLLELKKQGGNSEEVRNLEEEIRKLLAKGKQNQDNFSSEKLPQKKNLTPWIVGGGSVIVLVGIIWLTVKIRYKRKK